MNRAGVLVTLVAVLAVMGVSARPAAALAAPAARAPSHAMVQPGLDNHNASERAGDGRSKPGGLNVAMLIIVAGLGLVIGAPIAGRARLARELFILRFRGQLRNADLVTLFQPRTFGP